MLDIAYYLNDEKKFAESELTVEENCAPHYDPGLLSLSVLSTHTGLELYDPYNGQWIPHTGEDKRIAVLWCGKAALEASYGLLRPAVHRVIRQLDKPRIAIWYEICTFNQVPEISQPLIKSLIQLTHEEQQKLEQRQKRIPHKITSFEENSRKRITDRSPIKKRHRSLKKKKIRRRLSEELIIKKTRKQVKLEARTGVSMMKRVG